MSIMNQFNKVSEDEMDDSAINYEAIDPIRLDVDDRWPHPDTYPPYAGGYAALLGALWLDCTKTTMVNLADDFVLIGSDPGVDDDTATKCLMLGQAMLEAWEEGADGTLKGLPAEFQLTDSMRKFCRPRLRQCTYSCSVVQLRRMPVFVT